MDSSYVGLIIGFGGAVVGGGFSIGSQVVTQKLIGSRDRKERDRHERRVRALFATCVRSVDTALGWQVEDGSVWDLDEFERRLLPLRSITDQPALVLALEPKAIDTIAEALRTIDIGLRFARREKERFDQAFERAASGEEKGKILDGQRKAYKAAFAASKSAFMSTLSALGEASSD